MLHIILSNYRESLIDRCLIKVDSRTGSQADHSLKTAGIPLFLDQLILTLELEQSGTPHSGDMVSGPAGGPSKDSDIGRAAIKHGRELSDTGYTLEQVVHDYGDLCQAIMDLAVELALPIELQEFRTLNRCLDNAIADAVTEFSKQRRLINDDREKQVRNHRIAALADELRTHIKASEISYAAIKSGQAGLAGATSKVLDRSLKSMRNLLDHPFIDAQIHTTLSVSPEVIMVDELLGDIKKLVSGDAQFKNCKFAIYIVGVGLALDVDRKLISSAIVNLLENAFKFTRTGSDVTLTAYSEAGKLLMDIQDHCGGLGHIEKEDMFMHLNQSSAKKAVTGLGLGLGLGLSTARSAVEVNGGMITVRDLPGSGCVFTISLPLHVVVKAAQPDPSVQPDTAKAHATPPNWHVPA